MSVESLQDLFLDELKDLYSAEKQITKALPKMVRGATPLNSRRLFRAIWKKPMARSNAWKQYSRCSRRRAPARLARE